MADSDNPATTEVHVYKPDPQGTTVVIEEVTNASASHQQTEQLIIENPNDPLSTVTHRLEDVHVTVNHEPVVAVDTTDADFVSDKTAEVANNVQDNTAELKQDANNAVENVKEKTAEVANNVQDKATELNQDANNAVENVKEKAVDFQNDAAVVAHDVKENASELAGDATVKAEEKLETAEKIGEQKGGETKQWLSEKSSEAKAKGAGILDATQHAFATGAAKVSEKAKHGMEKASEAAHSAQVKAHELLNTAENKAAAAADVIAAKAVEAKKSTVAAAHNAASTVHEKTSALVDSSKHVLASSNSPADRVSQEAYVTETSPQTVLLEESPPPKPPKANKRGAMNSIRKFFARIFNSSRRRGEGKITSPETVQTNEIVATPSSVATTNPPQLS